MASIPLALYMWKRIRETGIESIMGLPGDFNLNFLDYVYDVPGLKWVGNANELNSAYAADGYARFKGSPGCLVTTHGVGELSALNGISGSASECVPVIHIVGQTPKVAQDNHLMIHHSIGFKPDHQQYNKASAPIRCAAAELWDPKEAPAEIDRVIRECVVRKKPVYIFFPIDLTAAQVPASLLEQKLDLSLPVDVENEKLAVEEIERAFEEAHNPAAFVDHLVNHRAEKEVRSMLDRIQIPTYASWMGKGLVDETKPYFVGLYSGKVSFPGLKEAAESHDFVLSFGWFPCDTNTSFFSRQMPTEKRIDILDDHIIIKGKRLEGVYMQPLLARLSEKSFKVPKLSPRTVPFKAPVQDQDPTRITHAWIWSHLSSFLKPNDIIIGETGTTGFGIIDTLFPENTKYICQTYYGSIGYSLPAALGAYLASRELRAADPSLPERRTVLFIGDGSAQLTVQELGTMINNKAKILIVLINNDGYTIERAIHGARQQYNDITPYAWAHALSFFGSPKPNYHIATTPAELEQALRDPRVADPQDVRLLEVKMERLDVPWRLARALELRDPEMGRAMRAEGFLGV